MLEVCLLGCGGMVPLPERRLTSMLLRHKGKMLLVDCGEGTQIGIKMLGWGFKAIDAICFTHYHADHIAGLPGFLLTLGNSGKTEALTIYGPPPLEYVITALTVIAPQLPYEIRLAEISHQGISEDRLDDLTIRAMPGDHMIPCLAYSFETNRIGKFDVERAQRQGIPREFWSRLQQGISVEWKGRKFTSDMVLGPPRKGLKVSYCTDSRPRQELWEFTGGSDLLICEGMYGDEALQEKAVERKHMIFSEAAVIAKEGNSKELWLTHFSPSLVNPCEYLHNATGIFPNTLLGEDLLTKQIKYKE